MRFQRIQQIVLACLLVPGCAWSTGDASSGSNEGHSGGPSGSLEVEVDGEFVDLGAGIAQKAYEPGRTGWVEADGMRIVFSDVDLSCSDADETLVAAETFQVRMEIDDRQPGLHERARFRWYRFESLDATHGSLEITKITDDKVAGKADANFDISHDTEPPSTASGDFVVERCF